MEGAGSQIPDHGIIGGPRFRASGADIERQGLVGFGSRIGLHELRRPGQTGEGSLLVPAASEIEPRRPMPIEEAMNVFRGSSHWQTPVITSSHSFPPALPAAMSNAWAVVTTIL